MADSLFKVGVLGADLEAAGVVLRPKEHLEEVELVRSPVDLRIAVLRGEGAVHLVVRGPVPTPVDDVVGEAYPRSAAGWGPCWIYFDRFLFWYIS